MQPGKCPCCGESQFRDDQLQAGFVNGEKVILSSSGPDANVHCSVCLSCGFIATSISQDALAKLRSQHPEFKGKEPAA